MKVTFCGQFISDITITDKAWRINSIGIGSTLSEVMAQYKYVDKSYTGDAIRFVLKENSTDDVLYIKSDAKGIITEFGFGSPCT